ncbi:MAG TPA: chaperone modulator CbpM [Woeseiaceae bacterium]|jgi:chaperone modulatory protein CbpM
MPRQKSIVLSAEILEIDIELSLTELCEACGAGSDTIVLLVEGGVLEPSGAGTSRWRFSGDSLQRAKRALRLQQDLGLNVAGIALALDLLDELYLLRGELRRRDEL